MRASVVMSRPRQAIYWPGFVVGNKPVKDICNELIACIKAKPLFRSRHLRKKRPVSGWGGRGCPLRALFCQVVSACGRSTRDIGVHAMKVIGVYRSERHRALRRVRKNRKVRRVRRSLGHPTYGCLRWVIMRWVNQALKRVYTHRAQRRNCRHCKLLQAQLQAGGPGSQLGRRFTDGICKRSKSVRYWSKYLKRKFRKYGFYVKRKDQFLVRKLWISHFGERRAQADNSQGCGASVEGEEEMAEEIAINDRLGVVDFVLESEEEELSSVEGEENAEDDVHLNGAPASPASQEDNDQIAPVGEAGPVDGRTLDVRAKNVGGLRNTLVELLEELGENPPDVVALQECFGKCSVKGLGWSLVRNPRPGVHANHGGGTGFLIRKHLQYEPFRRLWFRSGDAGAEICWIRVKVADGWLYIGSVYAPPGADPSAAAVCIGGQLQYIVNLGCCGILICGDFNSSWYSREVLEHHHLGGHSNEYLSKGQTWRRLLTAEVGGLQPCVLNDTNMEFTHSTHTNNRNTCTLIDYMVWVGVPDVASFEVLPGAQFHRQLAVRLPLKPEGVLVPERINWRRLSTDEAARTAFKERAADLSQEELQFEEWSRRISAAARATLGVVTPRQPHKFSQSKWWNHKLTKKFCAIRTLRRKLHRNVVAYRIRATPRRLFTIINCRERLRESKTDFRTCLYEVRRKYWTQFRKGWDVSRNSLNTVWSFLRGIERPKEDLPHSRQSFENAWEPIFGAEPPETCLESLYRSEVEQWEWPDWDEDDAISVEELKSCIQELPSRKAPGKDGIPNELLRALPDEAIARLSILLTGMLRDPSTLPREWYSTLVCMIRKVLIPAPLDYRPISLLSCVAKLLEKVLHVRESQWVLEFHRNQAGFRTGWCTIGQVWLLRALWDSLKSRRRKGYVLFLDIRKAFDSVPIHILLHKMLHQFPSIPQYVVRFYHSWLRGHSHQLLVGGGEPRDLPVLRGVPQGSINSPSCYNMFSNDLLSALELGVEGNDFSIEASQPVELVFTENVEGLAQLGLELVVDEDEEPLSFNSLAFADDCATLSMKSNDLQGIVYICRCWGYTNGLEFAPEKCKMMQIGTCPKELPVLEASFGPDDDPIEVVSEFKYLGVKFKTERQTSALDIDDHCKAIEESFLKKKFTQLESRYGCGVAVGLHIVQAKFVPKLLYGCEVYDLPDKAQALWNRVLRKVLQCYKSDSGEKVREFTGSRPLVEVARVRLLRFLLTNSQDSAPGDLRRSLARVLRSKLSSPTAWINRARKQFERAVSDGWIPALEGDLLEHNGSALHLVYVTANDARCKQTLAKLNEFYKETKPLPHAVVRAGCDASHFTFRFWHGKFNPRIRGVADDGSHKCFLCDINGGVDTPLHLPYCTHETVQVIIDEEHRKFIDCVDYLGNGKHVFQAIVSSPSDDALYQVVDGSIVKDTEEQRMGWNVISRTHARLWRLRTKRRRLLEADAQEWIELGLAEADEGDYFDEAAADEG